METGYLSGTPGVTLADRSVRFGDIFLLARKAGVEFGLTREIIRGREVFRLYSGGARWVSYGKLSADARVIGDTHLGSFSRLPSEQDIINADAAYQASSVEGPCTKNPPRRVIYGPGDRDNTIYYGHL